MRCHVATLTPQAVNKRVPIIASNAGGIPLQVKENINGWIVPIRSPEKVGEVLFDIWQGKRTVQRDVSKDRTLDGKSDPNSIAQQFVGSYGQEIAKVHSDKGSTSEDFWTVGNAARWLLLACRVLGLDPSSDSKASELLRDMEVGKEMKGQAIHEENVWKMVMGSKMPEGEGQVRRDA